MSIPQNKTVPTSKAYEIWQTKDGNWTWYVLKKYQTDDKAPGARWFCEVRSPFCPDGELGDVYVKEIKNNAVKIK